MMNNEEIRRVNILREAISKNLEYKDLPEDFKEKYNEKFFRVAMKEYKSFQKFKHIKVN